jgi:hypothetical protein
MKSRSFTTGALLAFLMLTLPSGVNARRGESVGNYRLRILSARMPKNGGAAHVVFKLLNRSGGDMTYQFFNLRHSTRWRVCSKISSGRHSQDSMWSVGGYISDQHGLVLSIDQNDLPNLPNMMIGLTFMDEYGKENHDESVTIVRY